MGVFRRFVFQRRSFGGNHGYRQQASEFFGQKPEEKASVLAETGEFGYVGIGKERFFLEIRDYT